MIDPAATRLPPAQSEIRAMTQRCDQVGGINLGQGLCHVPPPDALLTSAAERISACDHSYSSAEGVASFRRAVATKVARYQGLDVDPDREVVATIGATGAFAAAVLALLDPGDEVLLIEPFYGYHLSTVHAFGLRARSVQLDDAFTLTADAMRRALTAATRAIVVCSPANPSGRRYGHAEIGALAAIAAEHDLLVITDEVYEHIFFGSEPHLSPASVGALFKRTVSITSLSKTFSVPGWRLGYAYGPVALMRHVRLAADTLVVCAPTPLQEIAADMLDVDDGFYVNLRRSYAARLDALTAAFERNGCRVLRPEGTYYALIDLAEHGVRTGRDAADLLLERCQVATIPLEAFQLTGRPRPIVRACFSIPDSDLEALSGRLAKL